MATNYERGRHKEYKIVRRLRDEGFEIAQRTAGSHSPIDIFAINKNRKRILFIQAKPDNIRLSAAQKIINELSYLNGKWDVCFEIR